MAWIQKKKNSQECDIDKDTQEAGQSLNASEDLEEEDLNSSEELDELIVCCLERVLKVLKSNISEPEYQ